MEGHGDELEGEQADDLFDRGLGPMPQLINTEVDPLPDPPPRAPRLDFGDVPLGALDPSASTSLPFRRYTTPASSARFRRSLLSRPQPESILQQQLQPPLQPQFQPQLQPHVHSRRSRRSHRQHRSDPFPDSRHQLPPSQYNSAHITMTLISSDKLRFENMPMSSTLHNLRSIMPSLWAEGVTKDNHNDLEWLIQFRGKPWSVKGRLAIQARRMLCQIFLCLANEGWNHISGVKFGNSATTRHIFETGVPDPEADFFGLSLSYSERNLTAIDCPRDVTRAITRHIRMYYDPEVISENRKDSDTFCLEILPKSFLENDEDVALLLAQILSAASQRGYRFDANVPMSKGGFLGFRKREELWVFRRATGMLV